jgi:hypothetical protein
MAMFARRVLQRCLDESFPYASDRDRHVWVSKLNSSSEPAYAATEWEVVLLHTIAQFGTLRHEPSLGGASKLDIVFENSTLAFGADITTISDRGLDERNPVGELEERLKRIYRTAEISKGAVTLSVLDLSPSMGRPPKGSSIVPPISDFDKIIFNEAFHQWIESLRASPDAQSRHQVIYRNPLSQLVFTYVPGLSGAWCKEHTSYRTTRVVDKNPLFNALTSKAAKLKRSGFAGKGGIVICDGGADVLRQSFSGTISAQAVVSEFLRRHTSVNFVVIFSLRNFDASTVRQRVESRIYVSREESWHKDLSEMFSQVTTALPQVMQSAENAVNELRFWEGKKRLHLGGLRMSIGPNGIREVRISTRTLLDVLCGRLSQKRFNEHYRYGNGQEGVFENLVRTGSLIESARVERKPSEDDDEIIFTFGRPDPASSAFKVPRDGEG